MFDNNFENINREPLILISGKAKLFGCILTDMDTVEKFEYTNNGEKVLEKCKCDSVGYRYWLCLTCSTLLQKCGTNHILCKCGKQEDSKKLERFCFSQKASFKFGDALIRCDKQVIEETVYVENVVEEIVAEEFAQEDAVAEEVENIVESSTEDEENDETIVKSEEILLQRTKDFSTETLNIQADEKNHMNVNQMCESKYENIPAQENASSDSEGETCHFTAKQKLHAKNTSLESLNPEHSAKIVTNHIYETPPDMNIYDSPPDLTTEIQ
uniref:Uncharacterized protein n=1 Tax=Panagrolaimus sp. ES5 TaxID=591445 RepID=A0AC34GSZ8_9BILA